MTFLHISHALKRLNGPIYIIINTSVVEVRAIFVEMAVAIWLAADGIHQNFPGQRFHMTARVVFPKERVVTSSVCL